MDSNVPSVPQSRRISSSGLPSFRTTKRHLTLKVGCRPGCIFSLWLKWACFTPANNPWANRNKIILNLHSLRACNIQSLDLSSQCSSLCVLPQAINLSQSLSNLSAGPTRNPTHPFTCGRLFGAHALPCMEMSRSWNMSHKNDNNTQSPSPLNHCSIVPASCRLSLHVSVVSFSFFRAISKKVSKVTSSISRTSNADLTWHRQ